MKIKKISQENQEKDFRSVEVKRLHGLFMDFNNLSKEASDIMEKWIREGRTDIEFEAAVKELDYYLVRLGLKT